MPINDLVSKIILRDEFSRTFDQYEARTHRADRATSDFGGSWIRTTAALGAAVGVVATVASAIDAATDVAIKHQAALANVEFSAAAANREFGNSVGTMSGWSARVAELSDELRVFSETDIANATTRLIDMTKRLGLSETQMVTLLRRTGDLAAGKVDLSGGVERVSAAMRGEAESAEYLGLSLNDKVVMEYALAQGQVWAKLTDVEKAQMRYQLFLQQTNEMQGRAAAVAETLAGKEAELARIEEENARKLGETLLPLRESWVDFKMSIVDAMPAIVKQFLEANATIVTGLLWLEETLGGAQITWEEFARAHEQVMNNMTGATDRMARQASTSIAMWREEVTRTMKVEMPWIVPVPPEVQQAYDSFLQEVDKGNQKRVDLTAQYNRRLEDMTWEHGRRLIDLQQQIEEARVETAEWGAEKRAAAEAKLAQQLADIDAGLAESRAAAAQRFEESLDNLRRDRAEAERDYRRGLEEADRQYNERRLQAEEDYRRGVEDANRKAGNRRGDVERDLAQALADLEQDIQDARTDKLRAAEESRRKIHADFAADLTRLEKRVADERTRINQQFADEWADADPFKRKMLQYNRDERLRMLDEEAAAERRSLKNERDTALEELEKRVAAELEVLEREAAQKKAILEREAQDRLDAIERDRAEALAALEQRRIDQQQAAERERTERLAALAQRLADEREHIRQREQEIREANRREIEKMEQQAARQRAQIQQRYIEELAQIEQQEQQRIAAAERQLENERKAYSDRVAQLDWWMSQERLAVQRHLGDVSQDYINEYNKREEAARQHQLRMSAIGGSGAPGGPGFAAGANFVVPPGYPNDTFPFRASSGEQVVVQPGGGNTDSRSFNVTVHVHGGSATAQQARQIGRSVVDALAGY